MKIRLNNAAEIAQLAIKYKINKVQLFEDLSIRLRCLAEVIINVAKLCLSRNDNDFQQKQIWIEFYLNAAWEPKKNLFDYPKTLLQVGAAKIEKLF